MDEDRFRFAKNDVVLCYYKSILYEGKCLKRKIDDDNEVYYYIHYYGWSNAWNEWVHDDKVLSINEFSVDHMAILHADNNIKINFNIGRPKKRRPSASITSSSSSSTDDTEPPHNDDDMEFTAADQIDIPSVRDLMHSLSNRENKFDMLLMCRGPCKKCCIDSDTIFQCYDTQAFVPK